MKLLPSIASHSNFKLLVLGSQSQIFSPDRSGILGCRLRFYIEPFEMHSKTIK
jgi:hypothetical protein